MSTVYSTMPSTVGELLLTAEDGRLTGLYMPADAWARDRSPWAWDRSARSPDAFSPPAGMARDDAALAGARSQLEEYFAGTRTAFDLPLAPAGTPFQQRVWDELQRVGYGETITYGELAARIGRPGCARAAGSANGANPVSIVIPCHRVIGANGSLTGYGGGIEAKRYLLELERPAR
jgi:methylated-DNA-[protein]-cysteine S-methyltransferase